MKKQSLVLILVALFMGVTATGFSQVRFGIKAGLNLADLKFSGLGETSTKMLPTYMVGGVVEFDFAENLGLGVGLQLHGKGAKDGTDGSDASISLGYLQVPVMLQYRNSGFFAGVGPYAAFGIFGKAKEGGDSEDISFGSGAEDDLSALDFGAGIELGYEFSNLRATASYSLGLANGIPKDQRIDGFD